MKRVVVLILAVLILGGCAMSRTSEYIEKAKSTLFQTKTNASISALTPGFVSGFKLSLNKEYKINIAPGIINVNGKQVSENSGYTITDGDWLVPMIQGFWYYLYVSDKKEYRIDCIKPVFSADLYAYYHPSIVNYRNIGKLYVHETYFGSAKYKPIYIQSNVETEQTSTVVAPSTYGGNNANYYCDGLDDNILINAAISFMCNAYGGGSVKLLAGEYLLSNSIFLIPGINICGDGWSTIIKSNANFTKITLTGTDVNDGKSVTLSDFAIDRYSTENSPAIYLSTFSRMYLDNLRIINANTNTISLVRFSFAGINNCSIENSRLYDDNVSNQYLIDIQGNLYEDAVINISKNKFINNDGRGIFLLRISQGNISGNTFYNNRWECINAYADVTNVKISDNNFINCNIFHHPTNVNYTISIGGGDNVVSNNLFKNCGRGISINNTNTSLIVGNNAIDCGNFIVRSYCTYVNPPMLNYETTSVLTNASFAKDAAQYREIESFWYHKNAAGDDDYKHYSFKFTKILLALAASATLVNPVSTTNMHGLTAGKTIRYSAWFYIPTASSVNLNDIYLRIGEYYSGSWHYTLSGTNPSGKDAWVEVSSDFTLNAGTAGFFAEIYCAAASPANSYFYVDDLRFLLPGQENFDSEIYSSFYTCKNYSNSWN